MQIPKNVVIPDPPGYAPIVGGTNKKSAKKTTSTAVTTISDDRSLELSKVVQTNQLKMKKAWELALSPAKSLPMQAIMLYMSGSGVQMFSMGIVWNLLTGPWVAVAGVLRAFEPFKQLSSPTPTSTDSQSSSSTALATKHEPAPPRYTLELVLPILVYILCQCAVLGLGIYKCSTMGLVPAGTGDWLQFETRAETPEWSAVRSRSIS